MFVVLSYKKRFDANKVIVKDNGKYSYVVRTSKNNGVKGYIEQDEKYLNEGNTISFGQDTATMFYQEKAYFTGDKIKILKPKYGEFVKKNAQFFLTAMRYAFKNFSWGNSSFNVDILNSQLILLPTKNGKIDFEFMEQFVAELEARHVAELEARHVAELDTYLMVTGLKDYHLTKQEEQALKDFDKLEWGEFEYREIFDKIKQGRRLTKADQKKGNIPYVMSGTTNNGVVGYISNPVASFPENSITIDIFGNTFYRNYSFGAGDDTGVYWSEKNTYSEKTMLYFATAMAKSLVGKFSYGKKLRSSQSFQIKMQLPIVNKKINIEFMNNFISAIQKLVIKDVVLYSERKIRETKRVIRI